MYGFHSGRYFPDDVRVVSLGGRMSKVSSLFLDVTYTIEVLTLVISTHSLSLRYEMEYEDAKRKTKESLHPLKVELADLEDQVIYQNFSHLFFHSSNQCLS
jgi:hypothetical protein